MWTQREAAAARRGGRAAAGRARDGAAVFKYSLGAHDVVEVSKADHDSCFNSRPLATFTTGDDTVPLPGGGVTRYFICGVPGHCAGGMKLAVRVKAAAAGAPNASAPSPAPVAMAPRSGRTPTAAPSPALVAMAPWQ
ncbi:hypothetical protein BAE44_0000387 [Dichanthelium oligosanthes]|uniref:Phytocyanin domain-containing protein n=1 Tax=Dichanthelium oligosanthes TaxID=888268 RepID=A0A1E5WMJ1_9POAL|nr:hypothetical protein BAE44_0000387 [Dichanthelium oligosanthes]